MKCLLCWALLAISVAGNLFFVGGYFYANKLAGQLKISSEARMDHLAKRLQLDEAKRQAMLKTRRTLIEHTAEFGNSRNQLMRDFWQRLGNSELNRQRLEAKLAQLAELELAHRLLVVNQVKEFAEQLDHNQRERLFRLLARRNLFQYLDMQSSDQPKPGNSTAITD